MLERRRIKKKDESVISGQAMARTKASGRIYKVKRNELISERSAQVEFGLNAAIAAAQFKMLDTDGKGHITADDLMRQLGRVGVAEGPARAAQAGAGSGREGQQVERPPGLFLRRQGQQDAGQGGQHDRSARGHLKHRVQICSPTGSNH